MLTLTRRIGQSIVLAGQDGRKITIQLIGIHGQQGRIGIEAPADIRISREEIPLRAARVAAPGHIVEERDTFNGDADLPQGGEADHA